MEAWEQRFCFNRACAIGTWMVASNRTAWPYTLAGTLPVCLYCGEDLLTTAEIEGGIGQSLEDEQGRVFDFLRRL